MGVGMRMGGLGGGEVGGRGGGGVGVRVSSSMRKVRLPRPSPVGLSLSVYHCWFRRVSVKRPMLSLAPPPHPHNKKAATAGPTYQIRSIGGISTLYPKLSDPPEPPARVAGR